MWHFAYNVNFKCLFSHEIHVINVIVNSYENHFRWVPKVLILHVNGFCAGTFIFYGTSIFRSLPKEFSCLLPQRNCHIHAWKKKGRSTYMNRIINLYYISQNKFTFWPFLVYFFNSFLFWTQNADWGSLMFFLTSVTETAEEQFVVHTTLEVCIHKSTLMWFSYSCINSIRTKQNLQSEFSYKSPDISCTGIVADLSLSCLKKYRLFKTGDLAWVLMVQLASVFFFSSFFLN